MEKCENVAVQAFYKAIEYKDFGTFGHCSRLRFYLERVGKNLGIFGKALNDLELFAQVHDIGKILIPDEILFKPGPLSDKEKKIMESHSFKGASIALSIPAISHLSAYIYHHHERWDGKGYPGKLAERSIPLFCRILSIADAFDAMTSLRPYQSQKTLVEGIRELKAGAGSQFDPFLVKVFIATMAGLPQQKKDKLTYALASSQR